MNDEEKAKEIDYDNRLVQKNEEVKRAQQRIEEVEKEAKVIKVQLEERAKQLKHEIEQVCIICT